MERSADHKHSGPHGASSAGFLVAQVGAHAAAQFRERLAKFGLAPKHAGVLRILTARAGLTQQALAETLGMVPSQLVALVDEMEAQGWIERRSHPEDRRRYALHVTEKGRATLETIGRVAREHAKALFVGITEEEQQQLADLLQRVADQQGLTRAVHPGYRQSR